MSMIPFNLYTVPTDNVMNKTNFILLTKGLKKFYEEDLAKYNSAKLNEKIKKVEEYLIEDDEKKIGYYFNIFIDNNVILMYRHFLTYKIFKVSFIILKSIFFLCSNIKNRHFINYLYVSKIIDDLFQLNYNSNEEFLNTQINFMKSISLKLKIENISNFYNEELGQFPLLTKTLSLYNHDDSMIRNVVRNIFLAIIRIDYINLRNYITSFPIVVYFPNLIYTVRNLIHEIFNIDINRNLQKEFTFKNRFDELINILMYISDILDLNIQNVNFIILNTCIQELIIPLIKLLVKKEKNSISELMALYCIMLILFMIKNKKISNIISLILFNDTISKDLMEKIKLTRTFESYDQKAIKFINYIIKNLNIADINDYYWTLISGFTSESCGVDLVTGKQQDNAALIIYDLYMNNIRNNKFENEKMEKNELLETMKNFFNSKDDSFLLILNLFIYCEYEIYGNFFGKKSEIILHNEFNALRECSLFSNINSEKNTFSLFDKLNDLLSLPNKFSTITDNLILINIQRYISYTQANVINGNDFINKNIFPKLKNNFSQRMKELNNILNESKEIHNLSYDLTIDAYKLYTKTEEQKINDLITIPWLLVTFDCAKKLKDYPKYLLPNETENDIFINDFMVIYYIYDIIKEANEKFDDLIRTNNFPLLKEDKNSKYKLGKIYSIKEKEETISCMLENYKNPELAKMCDIILSNNNFYLGELTSDSSNLNNNNNNNSSSISNNSSNSTNSNNSNNNNERIKIIKIIPLRRILMKPSNKFSTVLDIYDKNNINNPSSYMHINGNSEDNIFKIYNKIEEEKKNSIENEFNSVKTFLENISKEISN